MKKFKKIFALVGVILLVSLYLITLFTSIFCTKATAGFFKASIYCTILIPVIIYSYMLICRMFNRKNKTNEYNLDELEKKESESKKEE